MDWLDNLFWHKQLLTQLLLAFALMLTRISGLVMTAPIFGGREVPVKIRALLAIAMTVLLMPLHWNTPITHPNTLIDAGVSIGSELMIGVALGLGITILFTGIYVAGQVISQLSGASLAEVFNPGFGGNIPLYSNLLYYLSLAVFVAIGGHRRVVAALLETFETLPLGTLRMPDRLVDTLITILNESFLLGFRAAAPVMTALLLSTLVMGLISRTMPQMNIMAFGFGLNTLITIAALSISVGAIAWAFQERIDFVLESIVDAFAEQLDRSGDPAR